MPSVIKSIDGNGEITELMIYTLDPFKALICYLEQTINKNFKTWDYFSPNFVDTGGRKHRTKSKFIGAVRALPSGQGYAYVHGESTICAYSRPPSTF